MNIVMYSYCGVYQQLRYQIFITMRTYGIVPVLRRIPTITIITININLLLSMIPSDRCLFIIFFNLFILLLLLLLCFVHVHVAVCLFVCFSLSLFLLFECCIPGKSIIPGTRVYLVPTFTSLFVKPRASVIFNSFGLWFVFFVLLLSNTGNCLLSFYYYFTIFYY